MKRSFLTLLALATLVLFTATCSDKPEQTLTPQFDKGTDAGGYDLNDPLAGTLTINGAVWEWPVPFNVGTGQINPFLSVQNDFAEECFNSDVPSEDCKRYGATGPDGFTSSLPLNHVPVIVDEGVPYREFILDANEANSGTVALFAIEFFDVWLCDDDDAPLYDADGDFDDTAPCAKVYDFAGHKGYATDEVTSGSGLDLDYRILIPESKFEAAAANVAGGAPQGQQLIDDCPYMGPDSNPCGVFLVFHVKFGGEEGWITGSTFEELSTINRGFVTVTKTAQTSYTLEHDWDIEKSVDQSSFSGFPGSQFTANYDLQVVYVGSTASAWAVSGTITITNPSSESVTIASVTDAITGGFNPTVTCPGATFPGYVLAAGATLNCTYTQALPDGTNRTNTATVTLADLGSTQASADIDFSTATVTEIDETATITDSVDGAQGGATAPNTPLFEYAVQYECDADEGSHRNIATITEDETGEFAKDTVDVTVACGVLQVTKTATPTFTRTYNWTIEKTVTPDTWNLFDGDAGTSDYEVTVTKTGFTDSNWAVSGTIAVHNPESSAASITSVTDALTGGINATVDCPGATFPYSLAGGGTLNCTYSTALPDATSRTNTATANVGGTGFTGTAAVTFGAPTTEVNATINVTDTVEGALGSTSVTHTFEYSQIFECDDDEGENDNTASIVETGQSADATVTVNCYAPTVTKDAATSLTRTWTWTIDKSIDESCFLAGTFDAGTNTATILEGEELIVCYDIEINATSADSDHAVEGDITVTNPNPALGAVINSVSDIVSPAVAASVECGVTFPHTIAAGGTLECTYDADLPDATSRTNTATAVQQNHSYASDGTPTATGTTDYTGNAAVSFAAATITEIDECVDVNDILDNNGTPMEEDLGEYCAADGLPHTFDVSRTFGGDTGIPVECGDNSFDNVATADPTDVGGPITDTETINIVVECEEGCTLTLGYWKTHNDLFNGGKHADETWELLANGEETIFFLSTQTWYEVFQTAPKGNVYYNLAHQYMAAKLNILAGASDDDVAQAILDAEALFATWTPQAAGALKGNNATRQEFISLAGTLGSFNEGDIGPGHCTENVEERL